MSTICVVSARRASNMLAQYCAQDFEDAIKDATDAEVLTPLLSSLDAKVSAKLAVFVALNFQDMEDLLASADIAANTVAVGYVFGAYPKGFVPGRNPVAEWRNARRRKLYSRLERLYLGIADGVTFISGRVGCPVSYLPMAANVIGAAAVPYGPSTPRPIAVSAFGRQHSETLRQLADHFNKNNSRDMLYATNFLHTCL